MAFASRETVVSLTLLGVLLSVATAGAREGEAGRGVAPGGGIDLLPIGFPDFAIILEDTVLVGNVLDGSMMSAPDFDPDGGAVTAQLMTPPVNGELDPPLASDGSFTYTPDPGVFGADFFVYLVVDNENNEVPVVVAITINAVPDVTGVAAAPGGSIEDCGEVREQISSIDVVFDVPMADSGGDKGANAVTNPGNYWLVTPKLDQDIGTTACTVLNGDDENVTISSVTYSDITTTATLNLAAPLDDGPYRLLVCDTLQTSQSGNATMAQTDLRTFRQETRNLLVNGQLDCDLSSWSVTGKDFRIVHSTEDVDDASISGSIEFGAPGLASQCVDTGGSGRVVLSGRWMGTPGEPKTYERFCDEYDAPQCGGSSTKAEPLSDPIDTEGVWIPVREHLLLASTTESVMCSFGVRYEACDVAGLEPRTFQEAVFLDDLRLELPIFADGFESGDTASWSTTLP